MAQVAVSINGRNYLIACDEGQESQVERLAGYVDGKVEELTSTVGQVGDSRLLVMVSLLIADELSDLRDEVATGANGGDAGAAQAALAGRVEALAGQIEAIAAALEAP